MKFDLKKSGLAKLMLIFSAAAGKPDWNAVVRKSLKMPHTILLVQPDQRPELRTWSDFETIKECLEGVCRIYEHHLKGGQNNSNQDIDYDIEELFAYLDAMGNLSCLVY